MKVINLNPKKQQGKTPEQIAYSEIVTYLCWIAFGFGIVYILVTDRISSLTIQQRADMFISVVNYLSLISGAFLLAWVGFDKQVKVGNKVRIICKCLLIAYIIGSVYYLFGIWLALYSFGAITCLLFIYGAAIANKRYDEEMERYIENKGIDTGISPL